MPDREGSNLAFQGVGDRDGVGRSAGETGRIAAGRRAADPEDLGLDLFLVPAVDRAGHRKHFAVGVPELYLQMGTGNDVERRPHVEPQIVHAVGEIHPVVGKRIELIAHAPEVGRHAERILDPAFHALELFGNDQLDQVLHHVASAHHERVVASRAKPGGDRVHGGLEETLQLVEADRDTHRLVLGDLGQVGRVAEALRVLRNVFRERVEEPGERPDQTFDQFQALADLGELLRRVTSRRRMFDEYLFAQILVDAALAGLAAVDRRVAHVEARDRLLAGGRDERAEGDVEQLVEEILEDLRRRRLDDEQPAEVDAGIADAGRAVIQEWYRRRVDAVPRSAMVGPARQLVGEREPAKRRRREGGLRQIEDLVDIAARDLLHIALGRLVEDAFQEDVRRIEQDVLHQRLTRAVLEIAVEYRLDRRIPRRLRDFRVVCGDLRRRLRRCGRTVVLAAAEDGEIPAPANALGDLAGLNEALCGIETAPPAVVGGNPGPRFAERIVQIRGRCRAHAVERRIGIVPGLVGQPEIGSGFAEDVDQKPLVAPVTPDRVADEELVADIDRARVVGRDPRVRSAEPGVDAQEIRKVVLVETAEAGQVQIDRRVAVTPPVRRRGEVLEEDRRLRRLERALLVVVVGEGHVVPDLDVRVLEIAVRDRLDLEAEIKREVEELVDAGRQAAEPVRPEKRCKIARDDAADGGRACRDVGERHHAFSILLERDVQGFLVEVVRVQRRHVEVAAHPAAAAREMGSQTLDDFAVDHRAAAVADEVHVRSEQLAAGLLVQVDQRCEDRVGRGFGETGIGEVGFAVPFRHQHHRLAVIHQEDRIGDAVELQRLLVHLEPAAAVAVVKQDNAAAAGPADLLAQQLEHFRLVERPVLQVEQRIELEAVREDRHGGILAGDLDRIDVEGGGRSQCAVILDLDAPVIALAGRQELGEGVIDHDFDRRGVFRVAIFLQGSVGLHLVFLARLELTVHEASGQNAIPVGIAFAVLVVFVLLAGRRRDVGILVLERLWQEEGVLVDPVAPVVVVEQAVVRGLDADIELRLVFLHAKVLQVDEPGELELVGILVVNVDVAERLEKLQRRKLLDREATRIPLDVDAREIDLDVRVPVRAGLGRIAGFADHIVDGKPLEIIRFFVVQPFGLGDQLVDIEDQYVGGAAIVGVKLLGGAVEHEIFKEAARNRCRRGKVLGIAVPPERIPDDADL